MSQISIHHPQSAIQFYRIGAKSLQNQLLSVSTKNKKAKTITQ